MNTSQDYVISTVDNQQRLPNGNYLIACCDRPVIVRRDGKHSICGKCGQHYEVMYETVCKVRRKIV